MATQWRLKQFLNAHDLKPAAVAQATEGRLSRNSVYALARGAEAVRFETLDVLLPALREITGEDVAVSDLIHYEPDPVPSESVDADSALWLGSALTPALEPWVWGPGGEPEGAPVEFVEGEGLYIYDMDEA